MKGRHGWVSVPVLVLVVILSLLLVRHQVSLNDSHLWQTQRAQYNPQSVWQESYQALSAMSATAGEQSHCAGFCRPQDGHWHLARLTTGQFWLQKQRIARLGVERWCATADQQRVRCWWLYDNGEQRSLWLQY
ncbi:hypothetical protein MAQ5080_00514 [Marinomonas aquimarina]|uniref:Uncharacterized protein n=1 Tax=Marinomonas aquimarina TaxID=295068 RepID=A0A1A8T4J2_9GAMM|nr:hypothetical protein [Marinomonas aquimarina]SBS26419.1 hypothetical protein MAQ5080_00514 [Marinomonas aquimarina]